MTNMPLWFYIYFGLFILATLVVCAISDLRNK